MIKTAILIDGAYFLFSQLHGKRNLADDALAGLLALNQRNAGEQVGG